MSKRVDVRYAGQSYEISLPYSPTFRAEFDRLHGKTYGYSNADRAVEVVNVRVVAAGRADRPTLPSSPAKRSVPKPSARRKARFGGKLVTTATYRWDTLAAGARAAGPAVITSAEATAVVPPGWAFHVDRMGNVICARASRR
jgi:N-methylhydantoinase A/oxoprolinase/acetone carboxylase beta subunit